MKQILYLYCIFFYYSCLTAPDISDVPSLNYIGISKNSMEQGLSIDSLFITFEFEDGDGDIGYGVDDNIRDITVLDNRTGEIYDQFKSPMLPDQGLANGVKGNMELLLFTTCCLFPPQTGIPVCESNPPPEYARDTLSLNIFLIDRAGNQSNTITTENIIIFCR